MRRSGTKPEKAKRQTKSKTEKPKKAKSSPKKAVAKKKPVAKKKTAKKAVSKKPVRKTTKKAVKKTAKKATARTQSVKALEKEILANVEIIDDKAEKKSSKGAALEQILFKVPSVPDPLIGTPKQVQKELDSLAKKMQRDPENEAIFNKIHLYMHGYLINVVLKKFPFIKGYQTVDIYQETLIALRFKAIPGFKNNKGMSFLNFAKMCIRRHLITLLNASKNRQKDQSMNRAISLDSSPLKDDEKNTYANIITDNSPTVDKMTETNEAFQITKKNLLGVLSDFEKIVLKEYLSSSNYKEISKNVSKILNKRYNTKSVDNALLRIRKKAMYLRDHCKPEDVPIFL